MKTYHQFSEDIQQLQRDLNTLQTQAAPKQRLQQRRHDAKLKGKNTLQKFKDAVADSNAAATARHAAVANARMQRQNDI